MSSPIRLLPLFILVLACQLPIIVNAAALAQGQPGATVKVSLEQQQRLSGWQHFIASHRQAAERRKLQLVNSYVNQFVYQRDGAGLAAAEHWATPYEFILHNGGDCEDFAIAKYFLLRSLGVPQERLQITYAYHRNLMQYHMVLMYLPSASGPVLVLDNLTDSIQPFAERSDIAPVYGFNQRQLWVLNPAAQRTPAGAATRLARWQALQGRMRREPSWISGPVSG